MQYIKNQFKSEKGRVQTSSTCKNTCQKFGIFL